MKIKIDSLNLENIKFLPDFKFFPYSCKNCNFWETTNETSAFQNHKVKTEKINNLRAMQNLGLKYGFIAYLDNKPIGYSQFGPILNFPRLNQFKMFDFLSESIFLSCLYIPDKKLRNLGIGSELLSRIISYLKSNKFSYIETLVKDNNKIKDDSDWLIRPKDIFLKFNFENIKKYANVLHLRKRLLS